MNGSSVSTIVVGEKVYVPTPSHGFVEAKIIKVNKDSNKIRAVTIKYVDDFIKETYGDDDVVYLESNLEKIVTGNRPYQWAFQNNKEFPEWVTKTFAQYSVCDKKNTNHHKKSGKFELLPQQKFAQAYLGHDSPYRGLLIYHTLGTGKTCTAIAVSENLKDNRNIVVLLPAVGLRTNFIEQGLKKCGDPKYQEDGGVKLMFERYTLITYKSSTFIKQLVSLGSLNNKVIIVDEVHNLATLMVNGLRGISKQGYQAYQLMMDAKNSKLVFLSGTPLVNTPFEITILFNVLRGPLEVILFKIDKFSEDTVDNYLSTLIKDERIGWVDLNRRNQSLSVILKLNSWDMEFEQTIRFVESIAQNYNSYVNFERTDKHTLFPETEEEFESFFVRDGEFVNKDMFQRRIVGLASYFKTPEKALIEFPEQLPDKIVKVEMSPHQFELYQQAREIEKKKERKAAQQFKQKVKKGDKVSTLARVFSREFSNFVFPDEIIRPFQKMKFITAAMEEKIEGERKLLENSEEKKMIDPGIPYQKKPEEITEEQKINKETLDKLLKEALEKLSDPTKGYLKPGPNGLSRYSPKMESMLGEINKDYRGLVLVYSSFRRVEGLEIFSRILEASGYEKYDSDKKQDEKYNYKRFVIYSGQEDIKTKQQIVKAFTTPDNKYGKDIRIFLVSSAGAEGLDLKNIRKVLIMDVFWHNVRLQQIIGRAVRKQSHYDLPENERNVQPIIYLSVFSPDQEEKSKEKESTDEHVYEVAQKKLRLNNEVLKAVQEAAIDCELNECENKNKCYTFKGEDGLAYLPKIQDDIVYGYEYSETKEIKKELIIAGITNLDEIVYKKGNKWFLGAGKKLKGTPTLVKGKKFAIDTDKLIIYDYNSAKQNIKLEVGRINELDSKMNEL